MDSDWLPKYKCRVINQSEMLLERQQGLIHGYYDIAIATDCRW